MRLRRLPGAHGPGRSDGPSSSCSASSASETLGGEPEAAELRLKLLLLLGVVVELLLLGVLLLEVQGSHGVMEQGRHVEGVHGESDVQLLLLLGRSMLGRRRRRGGGGRGAELLKLGQAEGRRPGHVPGGAAWGPGRVHAGGGALRRGGDEGRRRARCQRGDGGSEGARRRLGVAGEQPCRDGGCPWACSRARCGAARCRSALASARCAAAAPECRTAPPLVDRLRSPREAVWNAACSHLASALGLCRRGARFAAALGRSRRAEGQDPVGWALFLALVRGLADRGVKAPVGGRFREKCARTSLK